MKYYLDITLIPNAEANLGFLWEKVFQQIHLALVENKVGENHSAIAVSIVGYKKGFPLGNTLRLFALSEASLRQLNLSHWCKRLSDYCHISSVKSVPLVINGYAVFSRKNVKSVFKKAQRRAVHLGKPYAEVLDYLINEQRSKACRLPFINMQSQTTKEKGNGVSSYFPLFIEHKPSKEAVLGNFDCYGLSKTATVPWF